MKYRTFLLVLIVALMPMLRPQSASTQMPGSGNGGQTEAGHHEKMTEMHKQEMQKMKSDIEKMKASLAAMRANLATIRDTNELDRWRDNADLWQTMVDHMEQMQKMESMGPGMMQGHDTEGMPHSRSEAKPQ